MNIGLVLSSVPSYSETFFITKINGLANAGMNVILFANGKTNKKLNCKHIKPYPIFNNKFLRILSVVFIVPIVFIMHPREVINFWKNERETNINVSTVVKNIYINSHILTKKLNWLHFGFATTAIRRENVARTIGAKMAVSFRGYDINVYPLKSPGCYNLLWQRVNQVHSISNYLLQQAYSLGLPKHKSFLIIPPAIATPLDAKMNFEFCDPIQILTVARLTWIKGLEYGIQSISKLKAAGLKVQYSIVGDGPEYEKLQIATDELGLKNEVVFMGKLSHEDTLKKIRDSDIYIQPSLNEGFCNAVLEAQAMGCLCIVSNAGALPENVLNNETGWLVLPQDANELANIVIRTLELPIGERKRIAKNAQERAKNMFNLKVHMDSWKKFYSEMESQVN